MNFYSNLTIFCQTSPHFEGKLNALAASMAKEERIQEIAEDTRRKDDQFAAMLARMDAKDK